MNGLALHSEGYISVCAGGGGLDAGVRRARPGARCLCYVEIEAPACAGLVAAMEAGAVDEAPVWSDAFTFDGGRFRGRVAGVVGGTPCPEFSVANPKRKANAAERLATPRGSLFFRLFEIAEDAGSQWVFWENVGGAASALPHVFEWLEARGWRGAWARLRASDVGAPHERARIFLLATRGEVAHPTGLHVGEPDDTQRAKPWQRAREDAGRGSVRRGEGVGAVANGHSGGREQQRRGRILDGVGAAPGHHVDGRGGALPSVAGGNALGHSHGPGLEERRALAGDSGAQCSAIGRAGMGGLPAWPPGPADDAAWRQVLAVAPWLAPALPQPALRRVVDGMAVVGGGLDRIEFLRLFGNGVVPEQAEDAFLLLSNHLRL